jgi:hypothetical protein
MNFIDIYEELINIYTVSWFEDAENKFKNHPSNKEKGDSFEVTYSVDYEKGSKFKKVISFEDFLKGANDIEYDDIYDEIQNNKLVTVGELPNGYPEQVLPEDEVYISSSIFYPNPTLNLWIDKLTLKIDKSLSLITSLAEKELFLNSIASVNKEYKELIKGKTLRSEILSNVLEEINSYISQLVEDVSELNTFIEDKSKEATLLNFNLDQANLAKLIKLLIDEKIIDDTSSSRNEIVKWFSRNSLVKSKNSKRVLPRTLDTESRRLSRNKHLNLKDWFNNLLAQ